MFFEVIIPFIYFVFFLFIIGKTNLFNSKTISKDFLVIVFALKAFCAILFGMFFKLYLSGLDTFIYFNDANIIHSALDRDFETYLQLLLGKNNYHPVPANLLPYTNAMHFWFDISNYLIVRINAFIRLFSFGIYNVHAIFFAFISFVGMFNLYRFFENKVQDIKVLQLILFGIPTMLFWTSGVHKEAVVMFALGLLLYNFSKFLKSNFNIKNIFYFLVGFILLSMARAYLAIFILPLLIAYFISIKKYFNNTMKIFLACIFIGVFSVLIADFCSTKIDLINEFFLRRAFFINSDGATSFSLGNNTTSFQNISFIFFNAITNPFFRPFPNECSMSLIYLASLESVLLLITIITLIYNFKIKNIQQNPIALFSILFGCSTLFLIGLLANNSGAIVRYRSIALPFILIGFYISSNENSDIKNK